jgi:asparagine N-glycosylation enzyme membrane subunit Stt3
MTDFIWSFAFAVAFLANAWALTDIEERGVPPVLFWPIVFLLSASMTSSLIASAYLFWSGIWSLASG